MKTINIPDSFIGLFVSAILYGALLMPYFLLTEDFPDPIAIPMLVIFQLLPFWIGAFFCVRWVLRKRHEAPGVFIWTLIFFTGFLGVLAFNVNNDLRQKELRTLLEAERYQELVELSSRRLKENPGDSSLLHTRALAYFHLKDFEKAIGDMTRIIASSEPDPFAENYVTRGSYHLAAGNPEAALSDFEAAVALHPGYRSLRFRAKAKRELGHYQEALSDADQAIKLKPTAYGYLERAKIFHAMGERQKARSDLATALGLDADDELREEIGKLQKEWSSTPGR